MKSLQKKKIFIYENLSLKHPINLIKKTSTFNFTLYLKTIKNLLIVLKKKLKIVYKYLLSSFKIQAKKDDNCSINLKSIISKLNSNISLNVTNPLLVNLTVDSNKFSKKKLTEKKITINKNEVFIFCNFIYIFLFKQIKQNIVK